MLNLFNILTIITINIKTNSVIFTIFAKPIKMPENETSTSTKI